LLKIVQPGGLSGWLSGIWLIPSIFLFFNFIVILVWAAAIEAQISRFKSSGIDPLVEVLNQKATELPPLAAV